MTDATFAGTLPAWYEAGHADAVAGIRQAVQVQVRKVDQVASVKDIGRHAGERSIIRLAMSQRA